MKVYRSFRSINIRFFLTDYTKSRLTQLAQRSCGNVENESCTDVSLRHRDNVALQRCQDVASTFLQRRHNIKHWITRPFYYGLFWFLSLHRNVKVTKVLSGIKHASFLFKKTLHLWLTKVYIHTNQVKYIKINLFTTNTIIHFFA